MKMNEIIRKQRLEKGFTQEQLATCLGVSAPAVNKWKREAPIPTSFYYQRLHGF